MVRLVVVALQWLVRHALMLLVIMAVLATGSWALKQMHQLEQSRGEVASLQRNHAALHDEPSRVSGWLDALLAGGSGAAADAGDALRRRLAAERAQREARRAVLAARNPIRVRLPGSDDFLAAARLDIEIGALRQAEAHLQAQSSLAQALGNAEGARRAISAERAQAQAAIDVRLARRRALAAKHTFLREIPGTSVYREIDRLDAERRDLEVQRARHDASMKLLDDSARLGREWQRGLRIGPEALRTLVAPIVAQVDSRAGELDRRIRDDLWRRATEEFTSVFVPALLVLAGAILSGPLIKTFTYFVLAPLAARRPPIRLPDAEREGGELHAAAIPMLNGKVSSSTLPLVLADGEELRVHADFLQSRPGTTRAATLLWLDPTRPFTSLAADMALVQHVLPDGGLPVMLSSTRQDLLELALLDLPAGSAVVLRPRGLAGLVQRIDRPIRITSHWRFASLHAWLDLQFRYLVFHGPGRLVLKGSRGVIVEASATGRTMDRIVNQAGVLGWSVGLARSSARCDSFPAYLLGKQDLLNDRFHGTGHIVYEEMPGAGASHSLVFGKGWTGLTDSVLKVFGI
ncbi:MAG: hypothetical protein ABIO45_14185 [Burkholderiaceae bacterium]